MKKLFLGICYLLVSQIILSQPITGTITDLVTGNPVPSATVEAGNYSTLSNENGQFTISRFKEGTLLLRISSIGYKTLDTTIQAGNGSLNIKLEPWQLYMQPVEVRAIRAGDNAPFTKTNIAKKEIEKMNLGQDLPFLLNQTPSVVINSDAGNGIGYTGIRIRGSDATRINMTINGIPYNDAESQGLFFVNLPDFTSSVNNIQIQRGVGTSSNGAGAFGATLNFSTHEVNTTPYAELNNSYGSFNSWKHTVKAGTGLISDHFTFDARLSSITSDGYIDRATSKLQSYYLSGAWLNEKTAVRLNILSGKEKTYQAWYGVSALDLETNRTVNYAGTERPGAPYDNETDNYKQDHYQLFVNHGFNSKLSFNTAFFLTHGEGYYEQYKAGQFFADYGLPDFISGSDTLTQTDLIRQLWLDNDFFGQVFSFQYKGNKNLLTLGGGWNRYDGNHFGKIIWANAGVPNNYTWYDLEAYKTDVNIYGKYQQQVSEKMAVFADLQYRRVLYNLDGFRDNPSLKVREIYDFFNPKFGFTYSSNNYLLYASYAIGQKEPNRDDFEAGLEQVPGPEKLQDIELGIEKKSTAFSWGATLYYMKYNDQLVLTGKINDVGAYTRTNIPDSYRMGVELQGKAWICSWMQASGNLSLSENTIKDFTEYYDDYDDGGQKSIFHGNTDIAFSPGVVAGLTLSLYPIKNLEISLPAKYVGRQYLDNTTNETRSLDPFYVQDLRIIYSFKKVLFKEINLHLQVYNLLDTKYEPNGYSFSYQYGGSLVTENYYYPMAGTNWMVGLNIKL